MGEIDNLVSQKRKLKSVIIISIYIFLMIVAAIIFNKYVDRESLQTIVMESGKAGIIVYFL